MDLALPPDSSEPPGVVSVGKGSQKVEAKEVNSEINLKGLDQSWIEVAQNKKHMRKYEVEVALKDRVNTVAIPNEIVENSTPLWEDFVVGKFLDLAPHVAKVHMVLNKI